MPLSDDMLNVTSILKEFDYYAFEGNAGPVKSFLAGYLEKVRARENDPSLKTMLDKFLMYYETASGFKGQRFGKPRIDVFGYRFKGPFSEESGHIKNGYIGQQARYMILQQRDYEYKGKHIRRPLHIVWRDGHNNCCTPLDVDLIMNMNLTGRINRAEIFLLPSSRYYTPEWNDKALCVATNEYVRRSAVAGWVQMCNFTDAAVFLDTLHFVMSSGLAFLLNAQGRPALDKPRLGRHYKLSNSFEYGIDEYANTQFFNIPYIMNRSIFLFHCYHSDLFSIRHFWKDDPVLKAYLLVTAHILKASSTPIMSRRDMLTRMEALRNPHDFEYELRACMRLLMSIIPNKYQMLHTVFCVHGDTSLSDTVHYGELMQDMLSEHADPSLVGNINFANLQALGITCNFSVLMNASEWCESPYFKQTIDRVDCSPSLFLSGLYEDALPETPVTQVRMPADIAPAFEKCNANKERLRLKRSDYKLDANTKVDRKLERYIQTSGKISSEALHAIRATFRPETLTHVEKVASQMNVFSNSLLAKFVWRILMLANVDIPRDWFQIDSSVIYPSDHVFRPMIEELITYSRDQDWVNQTMSILQ